MDPSNDSPNPRPRQQRRSDPGVGSKRSDRPSSAPAEAQSTPPQPAPVPPPPPQATAAPSPAPDAATMDMFGKMFQAFMLSHQQQVALQQQQMQQQQAQFAHYMSQQLAFQDKMLAMQSKAKKERLRKGDPPSFSGKATEDVELWLFSTEQYYADWQDEMKTDTSEFVDLVFSNLGPAAQTWFRDFKNSLGKETPATWTIFKERLRKRYCDADAQFKVLGKLYNLRYQGSQKDYTTRFMDLLSQLEDEMPEVVKRWFYQQNIPAATSTYVSQNIPKSLQDTILYAQRFEDTQPPKPAEPFKTKKKDESPAREKQGRSRDRTPATDAKPGVVCHRYNAPGHIAPNCPEKKGKSGVPKNDRGYIGDRSIRAFVDSGASFNAISPALAASLNLKVARPHKPLHVTLGHNQKIVIPRLVTEYTVRVDGFPEFTTQAFVMPIPEDLDILLGIPWLSSTNPDIDWSSKTIRPRDSSISHSFRQCVPVAPAQWKGGKRCRNSTATQMAQKDAHADLMLFYTKHACPSRYGDTKVVPAHRLKRLLSEHDNEFCFVIRINEPPTTEKAKRQQTQSWDTMVDSPAFGVVSKYKDTVFRDELPSTPPVRPSELEAEIELVDDAPVARKPIRLSAEMRTALREWTKEMLRANVIRKSTSPYCAPTFCVKKPVGWRIVHDFRGLNAKVRIPATPIPRKDDIFDAMASGRVFSAMDLLWVFYQVRLRESDIPYTAFATPDGLYEYLVTPMGLSSSPASFNRMIQYVFKDLEDVCRAYFDDVFVFTSTDSIDDHLVALDRVLARCEERQLYIKLSKCVFCSTEIPCLGDYFGRDGIRMDPDKIRVISEWAMPTTKRDMMSFIGTCVYVLKFCPDFAALSAPLTASIQGKSKSERLDLTPDAVASFEELKRRLASPPVLSHPDFDRPFHVRMDASDYAIGGYLFQVDASGRERVIAYGGRKLKREEIAYPTREKELLAALHAMRTWKVYLIDQPFSLNTDHRTLETILQQKTCSQRLARWLDELCMFQPMFKWIAGDSNTVADAISRVPQWQPPDGAHHVSLVDILARLQSAPRDDPDQVFLHYARSRPSVHATCRQLYAADPTFGPVFAALSQRELPSRRHDSSSKLLHQLEKFRIDDGLLLFRAAADSAFRLCIPSSDDLRNRVIYEEHDAATRGHPGVLGTLPLVRAKYFWPHMEKTVRRYVRSCEMCQRVKHSQLKPAGLLHPLEIPSGRWRDIAMDFMVTLPVTRRNHDQIMVLADRLTKRAHFVPVPVHASAADVATLFRDFYQRLHGLPSSIVSDRDSKFTSQFWRALMAHQRTTLRLSSAFKPSTDGQAERTNQFIISYLRVFIGPHHDDWDDHLALAEFAYNSRTHSTIGMSPFMADLGYNPRSAADIALMPRAVRHHGASTFLSHQSSIMAECQDAMAAAQRLMKDSFDRRRPDTLSPPTCIEETSLSTDDGMPCTIWIGSRELFHQPTMTSELKQLDCICESLSILTLLAHVDFDLWAQEIATLWPDDAIREWIEQELPPK